MDSTVVADAWLQCSVQCRHEPRLFRRQCAPAVDDAPEWLAELPRFLTFKQASEAGGHVRKGEHGNKVVFVKDMHIKDMDAEGGSDTDEHLVRMLKQYAVFNVAQCEGLPEKIVNPPPLKPRHHDKPDLLLEEFLVATGANICEYGSRAVYDSKDDYIVLPARSAFDCSPSSTTPLSTSLFTGPGMPPGSIASWTPVFPIQPSAMPPRSW